MKDKYELTTLILRVGLGFVFFYFGIDKLINPINWKGFITPELMNILFIDINLFILLLGIFEIILGLMLILGILTRTAALIISLHLFLVIITQGFNQISVRDIGLFAMAISLTITGSNYLLLGKIIKKWHYI